MQGHRTLVTLFIVHALCFPCTVKAEVAGERDNKDKSDVTINLGALRITNRCLQLRCKVTNQMSEDVWVFSDRPPETHIGGMQETNADVCVAEDGSSLIVLRRMYRPYDKQIFGLEPDVQYDLLRSGETCAEELSVGLPIMLYPPDRRGFEQAIDQGVDALTRLVFQIGYYTTEDLTSRRVQNSSARIQFDQSAGRAAIRGWIPADERVATMAVNGIYMPHKKWLETEKSPSNPADNRLLGSLGWLSVIFSTENLDMDEYRYAERLSRLGKFFDEKARQIAAVYVELAERKLAPAMLTERLENILGKEDRERLLKELEERRDTTLARRYAMTPIHALEDLFYSFSLNLEEYRYAQRLFGVDEHLLTGPARQIADVYIDLAQGRIDPAELTRQLDKILSKDDREQLLQELQKKARGRRGAAGEGDRRRKGVRLWI